MQWLGIFIILLSTIGYLYVVHKKLNIDFSFVPLIVLSMIALVVYLGGIAHFLLETTYVVCGIGLLCFVYFLTQKPWKQGIQSFLSFYHFFFILGSLMFLVLLLNTKFIHYDNFSHWATVVKDVLLTNEFPTHTTTIIEFTNYPLGTTSLIYYGCKFLGHSQGIMLFIQGLLIFSCFYAMFGIIQEKKRFLLYIFLGAGCSLLSFFNITIRINNLLVDFILPVMSLAVFVIIYRYRHDLRKTWCIVPILGLLSIVKSTGAIFVLFDILYLGYFAFICQETRSKKNIPYFVLSLVSYLPIVIWQIHMKINFAGVTHKFDMTTSNLSSVYGGKTAAEVKQIIHLFIQSSFDLTSRQTIGVFLFEIVSIGACLFAYRVLNKKWKLLQAMIALDIMLVLYYVGILAMYIFSMPLDEAIYLAGFERYTSSIVVLFCGALVLCATVDIENSFAIKIGNQPNYRAFKSIQTKKYYQVGIIVLSAITIVTLLSEYNGMLYNQSQYPTSLPAKVEAVTGDRWNRDGKIDHHKYLVYASDNEGQVTNYYLQYISRYMLFADHIDGLCAFYEDNLVNLLKDYDYLVIVESDKDEKDLLNRYFNQSGDEKIYSVKELFAHMTPLARQQYEQIMK